MSFGTESAPEQQEALRSVHPVRARSGRGARSLVIAAAFAASVAGILAAGCGGGGGGGGGGSNNGGGGNATTIVKGVIEDTTDTPPGMANLTVSLNGQTTTTASDGSFTLTFTGAVPSGTISVTPPGTVALQNVVTNGTVCSNSTSGSALLLPFSGAANGQTDDLGVIQVFLKSEPPQPPCGIFGS